MAYTNVWSVLTPANTDPASGAASDMRKIRLDVQERMETLLGTGKWADDPITAYVKDVPWFIHWSRFVALAGTTPTSVNSQFGLAVGGTTTFYAPVSLPRGITISEMSLFGSTGPGSQVLTLESIDATTGTVTQATLATVTMGASLSQHKETVSGLSVAIDDDITNFIYYYLKLVSTFSSSANGFQGALLKFSRANIGQTV